MDRNIGDESVWTFVISFNPHPPCPRFPLIGIVAVKLRYGWVVPRMGPNSSQSRQFLFAFLSPTPWNLFMSVHMATALQLGQFVSKI